METRSRFHNALARGHVPELIRLRLRPTLNQRGQPIVLEGDSAVVARMTRNDGVPVAIRIPVTPDVDATWIEHYSAISASLPHAMRDWIPRDIEVLERGITLGIGVFPAVLMEWIDGATLLREVDRAALRGNAAVLNALASSLRNLASGLRSAGVAHGDLAADNLIVRRSGNIAAVDLDTLSWAGAPMSMAGDTSSSYRFPADGASINQRDLFAILVQYVSLMVLADSPRLRSSYGDPKETHGGAVLFSAWDLAEPGASRAFREIRTQVGADARRLLDLLRDACEGRATDLPGIFEQAVNPQQTSTSWTSEPAADPVTETWDVSRVIDRLRRADTRTSEASQPLEKVPDFAQVVPEEDELAGERLRLREAIAANDDANIVRYAVRLTDDPVANLYTMEVERVLADRYRTRIADAARQRRDEQIVHLGAEVAERKLPLDPASRRAVRSARDRADVRARLEQALAANDREMLSDLAVSGDLVVLGDTDRATLKRVLQALEWPNMQRALESDDDRLILEAFDEELFDAGAALPAAAHDRVMLARDRLAWVAQVRNALKKRDVDVLERLVASSPRGATSRLGEGERSRIELLVRRKTALDQLEKAMRTGNDGRILTALHEVEESGARIEDRMTWIAVRNVVERASLVERILDAVHANPVDDRTLAHLLPVAKTMGLMADPAFQGDHAWTRLEAMVVRGAAIRHIRRALETDDDRTIRRAAYPDVTGAISMLTDAERERVEAAKNRRE